MGTSYELFKNEKDSTIELHEMSCEFTLEVIGDSHDGDGVASIYNMTPEQVADAAIKMIHAASYFVDDPVEFMEKYAERARNYHVQPKAT